MPIKAIPPREGKTPYWYGRGTYLGTSVDRSTGARKESVCKKVIAKWEREIERGEFSTKGEATFGSAALAYMNAGGEKRFMTPLLGHFGTKPLHEIDQAAIDAAAAALQPSGTPASRNRMVYSVVSAVLKHAGNEMKIRRPKGSGGNKATAWLYPEQAERLFTEATKLDIELGILCVTLCYTGLRLSEALGLLIENVRLQESFAYVPDTKNGEPRAVFLPAVVVAALAGLPAGWDRKGRVFSLHKGGHLYSLLRVAGIKAEVDLPERTAFHIFRHTYATWMRRYGGLDTKGLVGTGAWKDAKSADRYSHVVVTEEAQRASLLPTPKVRAV